MSGHSGGRLICWAASDERGFDGRLLNCGDDFAILEDAHYVQSLMPSDGDDPYFRTTVYNFEVEDFHTYYVGPNGVWVHNIGCDRAVKLRTAGERLGTVPMAK